MLAQSVMNMAGIGHASLGTWQWSAFPVAVMIVLFLLAGWYVRASWLLGLRGRPWSKWRTASFLSGLVTVDLALQSPVVPMAMTSFSAHIVQHLLLMVVAPPLLALSAPSTLLLQTSSRATKTRWLHILRSGSFAALTHPVSSFFWYFGVMVIFFLTSLVNVAMNHMALMDLMNVLFLVGGTLYWWPLIGIDPIIHWKMNFASRMMNILLGSAVEAFLGVAITADTHPVASMYTVASTHAGGALLWISTEFITLGAFVPIYLQWIRSDERAAKRADLDLARRQGGGELVGATGSEGARRELTPWELEWIARTGRAPEELRLNARDLGAGSSGR